jgi:hypothetical protein
MKLMPRIPLVKVFATIMALQLGCVAFVYFREQFLLDFSQVFIFVALVLGLLLFAQQRRQTWSGEEAAPAQSVLTESIKTAGLFLFFMLFCWQLNYLSLYQIQPLMYTEDFAPIRYDIVPGDLLAVTLRLALQTWVLGIALALVFNKLPRNGEFGFVRGTYKKLSSLAYYISNISGAAVSMVMLFALALLTLDVAKFITKSAGADIMNVSQFDLVLLMFSLYLFNLATGFSKHLKAWGEQAHTSISFIISAQLVFFLVVYCLVRVMMAYLPQEHVYALMEPFYFDIIDPAKFPQYWQLFVTALSFFLVPMLAHYFYHACQGEAVFSSVIRLFCVPALLTVGILQAFPSSQTLFLEWMPTIQMQAVELNNITSRYEVTWVSYLSAAMLLTMVIMLHYSSKLTRSLVDILPEQVGRRLRRAKSVYAHSYPFFIALISLYLIAGVVVSLYFSSSLLFGTLACLGLCFVAGLTQQEA